MLMPDRRTDTRTNGQTDGKPDPYIAPCLGRRDKNTIISGDFYLDNGMLCVLIRIASMRRFENTQHTLMLDKLEKISLLCILYWRYD